jgi:hypothetical protein
VKQQDVKKNDRDVRAAVLLLMAIPSAMSLLLVGVPGMVLMMMMMTDLASLAMRNLDGPRTGGDVRAGTLARPPGRTKKAGP